MVKSKDQIKTLRKSRRNKHKAESQKLKLTKNWYPTTDKKGHFVRKTKATRKERLRRDIKAGQVLIVLSGRFRGRRVIFLKQLESGLLLVTGPYKLNGVPLKRVNQAYVIATRTSVNLGSIKHLDSVTDKFFTNRVDTGNDKKTDFFESPEVKKVSNNI